MSDCVSLQAVNDSVTVTDTTAETINIVDNPNIVQPEFSEIVYIEHEGEKTYNIDNGAFIGTAGEALGGHRVVVVVDGEVVYADNSNTVHANKVAGITTHAAANTASVTVFLSGEITEPSWSWDTDKSIYLGTNGLMTQTIPTSGFVLQIAHPITSTKIIVDLKTAIILT